ncbi:MAG: hypothetical protein EXR28_06080 [Betaproteobacteria bacterium]|nr:hypothetical protein [Betaproteobacteria bacterium]
MHTEVHIHGTISLKANANQSQIEQALGPWLTYVDIESLAEARSAHQDEPGIVFDRRKRLLEICWSGWVGRNFQKAMEVAFEALCPFADEAAAVEVSYYHEDGRDERGMVFVGPSVESIESMQRSYMLEDIQALLSRHFSDAEIGEVTGLVNQLFDKRWTERGAEPVTGSSERPQRPSAGKRHLH